MSHILSNLFRAITACLPAPSQLHEGIAVCDQTTMERLGLVLLLVQIAALAASVRADQAAVTLHRKESSLDPDTQRSDQNVVCEFHDILRALPTLECDALHTDCVNVVFGWPATLSGWRRSIA